MSLDVLDKAERTQGEDDDFMGMFVLCMLGDPPCGEEVHSQLMFNILLLVLVRNIFSMMCCK